MLSLETTNHLTVLLVDDDPFVRAYSCNLLTKSGFRVFQAECAEDALELVSQISTQIDLVITDMTMPGMNGRELADRLDKLLPGIGVLIISGGTDDVVLKERISSGKVTFLFKPFSSQAFFQVVRRLTELTTISASRPALDVEFAG